MLERKTICKPEALTNCLCWRLVGQPAASTAATDLVVEKTVQGGGKERGSGTCERG